MKTAELCEAVHALVHSVSASSVRLDNPLILEQMLLCEHHLTHLVFCLSLNITMAQYDACCRAFHCAQTAMLLAAELTAGSTLLVLKDIVREPAVGVPVPVTMEDLGDVIEEKPQAYTPKSDTCKGQAVSGSDVSCPLPVDEGLVQSILSFIPDVQYGWGSAAGVRHIPLMPQCSLPLYISAKADTISCWLRLAQQHMVQERMQQNAQIFWSRLSGCLLAQHTVQERMQQNAQRFWSRLSGCLLTSGRVRARVLLHQWCTMAHRLGRVLRKAHCEAFLTVTIQKIHSLRGKTFSKILGCFVSQEQRREMHFHLVESKSFHTARSLYQEGWALRPGVHYGCRSRVLHDTHVMTVSPLCLFCYLGFCLSDALNFQHHRTTCM